MSEPTPPKASAHHKAKSWTSTFRDDAGRAHCKRFGRVGKVSRAEANNRWNAWLQTEYAALKRRHALKYSVAQLCKDFYAEMCKGYIVDGKFTATINRIKVACESFGDLYGKEEADAMTPGKVAAWVESFIVSKRKLGGKGPKTQGTINLALSYIKRMYQWGMTYRGVSVSAAGGVSLVRNVRIDHPAIRRKDAVKSVAWETVGATCEKLDKTTKAMVELMWWTGMRPGEVRRMRACDINTAGEVWVYTPAKHKNSWRGKLRMIPLGPHAKEILRPILPTRTDAPVFTREDGKPIDRQGFAKAIEKAARAAGVEVFAPNRIRHSYAMRVRLLHGASAVQDLLGHAKLNQQQVYMDDTIQRAMKLAREVG